MSFFLELLLRHFKMMGWVTATALPAPFAHLCFQPPLQGTVLYCLRLPHKDSAYLLYIFVLCIQRPYMMQQEHRNTPGVNSQPSMGWEPVHKCSSCPFCRWQWQEPPALFSGGPCIQDMLYCT